MPKIYIPVSIAERMPVVDKPHPLDNIVLIDNCGIRHTISIRNIARTGQKELLAMGYTHWLEEVEVSEDVLEIVRKGGADV
ncbi:hypothetical protein ACFSQ3_14590 [Sphingobacterium corticis]|uniref:Uncharacterized protein n=1 Tax=Sphingobacterium corticis TaxID=1812823 RepID=A0ABW5NNF7_9SPHI